MSYKFGNLNFLVRFEVDCIEKTGRESSASASVDASSLTNAFSRMSINLGPAKRFEDASTSLHYIDFGVFDPNERLVELTTKGGRDFPNHKWNQLFFSQTNTLVIGWHTRGNLDEIEKISFDEVRPNFFKIDF